MLLSYCISTLWFPLLSICYKPFLPPPPPLFLPLFIVSFFYIDSDLKGIQLHTHLHTLGHNFTTQSKFRILRQIAEVCRLLHILHLLRHLKIPYIYFFHTYVYNYICTCIYIIIIIYIINVYI